MNQQISDVRNANWVAIFRARQESGLTIKDWCARNRINENSYYYQLHKLRMLAIRNQNHHPTEELIPGEPTDQKPDTKFAAVPEITASSDAGGVALRVTYGSTVIEVSNDASGEILSLLREVLVHAS